jgi:hypothetical protein
VLKDAVPAADGKGWVVPAKASRGSIDIRPYHRMMAPATRPTTQPAAEAAAAPADKAGTEPKPVLIIPKDQLKLKTTPDKSVVRAQ